MINIKAIITRPDPSKAELQNYKNQGYTTVVFIANPNCCDVCTQLNRYEYAIDKVDNVDGLLQMDNPLYRISHPNCICKFKAWAKGTRIPVTEPKPLIPEITPSGPTEVTPSGPAPAAETNQQPTEKNPWYKDWFNKFFKNKKKSDFKAKILRRAYDAKRKR